MKLTCPACGSRYDLDTAVSDADARRLVDLVAGVDPRVGRALIPYLALFRPPKTGLRWSRMLSLAQEIMPQIRDAKVTRNGATWPAPASAWADAMQQLADRPPQLKLPLKSHGYLLSIVAGGAEKQAADNERHTEEQRRQAGSQRRAGSQGSRSVGDIAGSVVHDRPPPPDDWREQAINERRKNIDDHQG